jgi:hypothetical protein
MEVIWSRSKYAIRFVCWLSRASGSSTDGTRKFEGVSAQIALFAKAQTLA